MTETGQRSDAKMVTLSGGAASGRIALLLGAGASRDAGLKLTGDLARVIVERVPGQGPTPTPSVQALNFVYSQMIGYQGERGDDPLATVNIETLVSALRLLSSRETHEVAPFVSSWKIGALGFATKEIDRDDAERLEKAVRKVALSDWPLAGDLAEHVRRVAQTAPSAESFRDAETEVLRGIYDELSKLGSVEYLRPIADLASSQTGGVDVISLNYDLAVEQMVEKHHVTLDRGVERWTPGSPLTFTRETGKVNLIKVHGSLDWELDDKRDSGNWLSRMKMKISTERPRHPRPWIVVGDREKLATSGPTLTLLHAAEVALQHAERLVIAGYSFGDAHINSMIQDWMTVDDRRTVSIVDPGWTAPRPRSYSTTEPIALRQGLAIIAAQNRMFGPSRVTVLPESAARGLGKAIQTSPEQFPKVDVIVTVCVGQRKIPIRVFNPGVDLFNVHIAAFGKSPRFHVLPLQRNDGKSAEDAPNGLLIRDLPGGDFVDLIADDSWDEPATAIDVNITGRSYLDDRASTSVTCHLINEIEEH